MGREDGAGRRWTWTVLLLCSPLLLALAWTTCHTPFQVTETVALLEDIRIGKHGFFDPLARAWYRPLYFWTFKALWDATGSLEHMLLAFRVLEVTAPLLLVFLFIWHLKPATRLEAGAAVCATAVLMGSPGFRDNLEIPMLMTLIAMPMAMGVWMLLTREPRWWHGPLVILLTLLAIGYKEQGLAIVPVVVIAWWTRAPGGRPWLAAAITGIALAYLGFRFTHTSNWPIFEQSMGLGLRTIEVREALDRFAAFPYPMYAYNALATMLTVLAGEPTSGLFFITRDVLYHQAEAWEAVYVAGSLTLTVLIVWWSRRTWPGLGRTGWTDEGRVSLAATVALLGCGALSVKYSRDRLTGMVAMFWALAAFHAIRAAVTASAATPRPQVRRVLTVAVAILAITWQLRAVGTLEAARRQSEQFVDTWLVQTAPRLLEFHDRGVYLGIFSRMRPQGVADAAIRTTAYPEWVRHVLRPQPD